MDVDTTGMDKALAVTMLWHRQLMELPPCRWVIYTCLSCRQPLWVAMAYPDDELDDDTIARMEAEIAGAMIMHRKDDWEKGHAR